ncbi:MAG: LamG domain-containing protein [Sulfitobacter sp.]|nr:LamG domain-containing protein [Sulfitobacter sp.]
MGGTESGVEALRAALTIPPALSQPIGGWYDSKDGSGLQEVPSRITGTDLMTLGSTSGVDANDPTWTDTPPRWVVAASDYFQLLASDTPSFTAATGKYSAVVTYKPSGLDANDQIIGANSASSVGLRGHFGNQYFRALCGGSTTAVSTAEPDTALTLGQKHTIAIVVDDGSMWAWDDINGLSPEADITGVGTITFNAALRIATRGYGVANTPEGDYYAIRTLPGVALTAPELADISAYLLGDYS